MTLSFVLNYNKLTYFTFEYSISSKLLSIHHLNCDHVFLMFFYPWQDTPVGNLFNSIFIDQEPTIIKLNKSKQFEHYNLWSIHRSKEDNVILI